MEKNNVEILERYDDINYVLIRIKDATYQPYVACWMFDNNDYSWSQGHYFCNKVDAIEYLKEIYNRRYDSVNMLEDDFIIRDIRDDEILITSKDYTMSGWFEYEISLDLNVPEDKACRVKVNGNNYYFG